MWPLLLWILLGYVKVEGLQLLGRSTVEVVVPCNLSANDAAIRLSKLVMFQHQSYCNVGIRSA